MSTTNPESAWSALGSEEYEDADEPPELHLKQQSPAHFRKSSIRKASEQSSLLTKAIKAGPEEESYFLSMATSGQRRRSLISLASTADLTSDTGLTSPSRPSTPSPPFPEVSVLRLSEEANGERKHVSLLGAAVRLQTNREPPVEAPRKRCIQFACGGKPAVQEKLLQAQPMVRTPSAQEAPRRSCIKFACPPRPASTQNTPPKELDNTTGRGIRPPKPESPSTPKRTSILSEAAAQTPRQTTPRRPSMSRPKFLRADSKDLTSDGSQFHEFASGMSREDDWLRHENPLVKSRLTINDTLTKENHIRRLATEAEEEAEEEECENDDLDNDDDDDDDDDDEDDVEELEDALEEEDDDDDQDDDSDGYHTDEETGFAESDDEEDDDLNLWTPSQKTVTHIGSSVTLARRPSTHEQQSDSSATSHRRRIKLVKPADDTPDLPDSTDFVCGTLDEDRPLEEAYLENLAARRKGKLRLIPQDIDPSFPASDPENEEDNEVYNPVHHESDEDEWLHGEMEDLHHERARSRRRRKSEHASPRKFRSPPPKRHISPPPPRARARSPKPLFDRRPSFRKLKSPAAPKLVSTPRGSPRGGHVNFNLNLAGRPGLTHTKSLPRPGAMFSQLRSGRHHKSHRDDDVHVRGAIDIVKGLEAKRHRRKEKFHQKYCNRARRGQIPERRPMPGRGAERMKELGLLMAGKKDQGNYVLSL